MRGIRLKLMRATNRRINFMEAVELYDVQPPCEISCIEDEDMSQPDALLVYSTEQIGMHDIVIHDDRVWQVVRAERDEHRHKVVLSKFQIRV